MPSLLELCTKHFNSSDLYQVIGVLKGCNEGDIKKAYYKQSLKVHPDRVPEDEKEVATEKFQTLGKIYSILSDQEKRKIYDETGSVDEENFVKGDMDWDDYWRLLFKKVTKEDIVEFEAKYKGSEEEAEDVKNLYEEHQGDMDKIMSSVLCATVDDEPRIREIIQKLIDDKEVTAYKAFTSESKKKQEARKRKANKEAQEAEKMAKDLGLDGGEDGLRALIQKRNQDRAAASDNFFSALEAKYADKSTKKRGAAQKKAAFVDDFDDEEEEDDDDDDDDEDYGTKRKPKRGKVATKSPRGRKPGKARKAK